MSKMITYIYWLGVGRYLNIPTRCSGYVIETDSAVFVLSYCQIFRGLELYPLLAEEFVVVLPQQHHLISKKSLSLKDLAEESFILHPRSEGSFLYDGFIKLCRQGGFEPRIVKEVGNHQTRICFVAAGMGITFIPEGLQLLVSQDLVCKPMEDLTLKLEFAAAWRSLVTMPVLQEFLVLLKSVQPKNSDRI